MNSNEIAARDTIGMEPDRDAMNRLFWNEGGIFNFYAESPDPPVPALRPTTQACVAGTPALHPTTQACVAGTPAFHPTTQACVAGTPAVRRVTFAHDAPVPRQFQTEVTMPNAECPMLCSLRR